MQRVNKDVFKRLEEILPNKTGIYPAVGDQVVRFPYVVYNCSSFVARRTKDGIDDYRMDYGISIVSDKFDEADAIADSIIAGLDGYRSQNIQSCILTGGSSGVDGGGFYQNLDFQIESDA